MKVAVPAASSTVTSLIEIVGVVPTSMTPMPVIWPMVNGTVSAISGIASVTVGTATVKLMTPAGTLKIPAFKVTPLLNVGAL